MKARAPAADAGPFTGQLELKSTEYEKVVAEIAASVARSAEGTPELAIISGKSNLWRGASGVRHQIDVSIERGEDIHLVECKCWERCVSLEQVLVLYGRLQDIRQTTKKPVEGVIVSIKGFQSGAQKVASHFKIHWNIVESADAFGFKLGKHILEMRPATVVTSVDSEVNAEIDGPNPSR